MSTSKSDKTSNPGRAFMRALRQDHAGLSRVMREIDAQAHRLAEDPEGARAILVDAFRYLLRYHHAFHHPREDRLFARIRDQDATLQEILQGLSDEHEAGEHETERLAEDLARASSADLSGQYGAMLVDRINDYLRHTRTHMRHEETVFYSRAERVLSQEDWQAIIPDDGPDDPITDLKRLSASYPALARRLEEPTSHLGLSRPERSSSNELRLQMLALTDLYGGLMYEAVDLTRSNFERLKSVRDPASLMRAAGAISADNLRFAGQCVTRPSRWAINTGAGLIVGWLKPYMEQ
jgi:hemerythrin-like domain-containing protein